MISAGTRSNDYALRIFEQCHESEVHVQLLVTMEECQPRVIGNEIECELLESCQHHHILDDARGRPTVDLGQLETVPM
jgi:hypothetical protein